MLADRFIHQGLGKGWFITFIVTKPAIAEHINHHIRAKGLAEFSGNARHMNNRFGIITIHMENRRHDHFGNIGRIAG